jgi:hypothetical protein
MAGYFPDKHRTVCSVVNCHDSVERSFCEIPPMKPKILTTKVVVGMVMTQGILKGDSSDRLVLPFFRNTIRRNLSYLIIIIIIIIIINNCN